MTFKRNRFLKYICACLFLLLGSLSSVAQKPSVPLSVITLEDISFGVFIQGSSGGTVTILPDGTRQLSGDIIETNISGFDPSPAIFELEANPGTLISMLKGSDISMSGSKTGDLSLQVGESDTSFPIIVPPSGHIQVSIGGILTVGNPQANPSGDYSGSLNVTFIQE